MQATRAVRVAASVASRAAGNDFYAKASPHLTKLIVTRAELLEWPLKRLIHCALQQWKSYTFTRNQRVQQLSPFEIDFMRSLFHNIPEKIKHKVADNFWDVAPPLVFFACLVQFVKWKREQILLHHRD